MSSNNLYKNKTTLELSSSWFIDTSNINNELYLDVFFSIINELKKKHNYQYLIIENISHTFLIFQNIFSLYKAEYWFTSSYYLYNFVFPTIKSNKMFICF